MADIKKIKIGDVTYDIRDNRVITLTDGGSKTAGTWVANTGSPTQNLTAYPDGQLFLYKVTVAGASTTTLNIDGLGAKTIYRGGTTKLTTQYGVGSYVLLYYSSSLNSGSFIVANDSDANSDNDKKTSSGDTSSKIYLVGATTQSTSGQTTYSHDTVYVGTDGHLYDSGKQVEVKDHGHANATASTDGFMSATDKANHDKMWNVWSADGTDETLVNKVEEVLTVFENFPEADNLVEVLSGKSNVGHTHGVTTKNAAPNSHTHTVTVSGTTGNNSGSAVKAVTGYGSFSGGSGKLEAYDAATSGTKKVSNGTRIPFVTSISSTKASASGTAKAGSETHTHTYDKATGIDLGSNTTADGGVTYVESVTHTAATLGGTKTFNTNAIKSVTLSASDTSTDGPKYVQEISGSAPSLTGTTTFVTGVTTGSGSLVGNTTNTGIQYVESISGGSAVSKTTKYMKFSAGTTPKSGATPVHTSTNSGANSGTAVTALTGVKVTAQPTIGLTVNTETATGRIKYVESISGGSGSLTSDTTSTNGIKYVEAQGTFSAGTTPPKSASFSGTAATITPTLTGTLNGTCLTLGITGASYTPAGSVTLTAGTAPSMGAATTKYLHHAHTAASATTKYLSASASGTAVGANGTASVAPSGHTHTYDKTTSITLTAGTAPSMNFNTGSSSDTPYISEVSGGSAVSATTKYLHHTHTSAKSAGTASVGIKDGEYTATTKYMKATGNAAGTGTVTISGGSITPTTKYFHPSITTTSTASGAPSATTSFVTGVQGGTTSATTHYLAHAHNAASLGTASTANVAPHTHTHSYGSSTALTTTENSGSAVAAVTEVKASTN